MVNRQKIIVVAIAVFVGLLHFVTGPNYQGPARAFVNGHLIDILLPFSMYLVFGVADQQVIKSPALRGLLVFMVGATAEIFQYFDVPVLGSTFDILDFLMYGLGVILGGLFEKIILARAGSETMNQ